MKKSLLVTFSAFIFVFAGAQGTWTQKANFGGPVRTWSTSFSVGSKGYIVMGGNASFVYYKDVWEWEQSTGVWTQKADYAGAARTLAAAFSIGTKGYVGTGGLYGSGTRTQEFYEYDPATNVWTAKANFPGTARYMCVGFSVGSKGYIGLGSDGSIKQDIYEYNPATNSWAGIANFPASGREGAMGFSIGAKGYVGCGSDAPGVGKSDFWEWDQATNTWAQKANVGGSGRCFGAAFSIGNKGYMGVGSGSSYWSDFWEWDQATNTWVQVANYGGGARSSVTGFSIGSKGYIGTGGTSPGTLFNDLWEFTPPSIPAGGTWVQKANFGGVSRAYAVGFSIGTRGYISTGRVDWSDATATLKDLWAWDQSTNVWTQKADFGGTTRNDAVAFSIGTKGYIGTGGTGSAVSGNWTQDFWEYDEPSNTWVQKANFSAGLRTRAVGFSIGSKGYIGTGWSNSTYHKDMWEWDQAGNTWTQKANLPGSARWDAVGISIGSKGYVGTGYYSGMLQDFWEFDPVANSWVQKANYGGGGTTQATGFSIGNLGYIGTGDNGPTAFNTFWEFNPAINTWTQRANYGGGARYEAVGFSIGSKGYIGTGGNGLASGPTDQQFWEYTGVSSACVTAPANLISWWNGEGNGNDIVNINDGTMTGGATFTSGVVNQAFSFDGVNDYVNVPHSASLNLSSALTIDAWFYLNNVGASAQTIVSKGVVGDHNYLLVVGDGAAADELEFTCRRVAASHDGLGEALVTTNANLVANTWYHVAAVADGSNKYLYLNGQLLGSNSGVAPYQTNSGNMEIGTANHGTVGFFNGKIDEVDLYDRALSVSEIQSIYNAGSYGKCTCTPPPFTTSQTNLSCNGGYNGAASITPTGGIPPFTYAWNTFPIQTTSSISNLSPGVYVVTITDGAGCTGTSSFNIVQPSPPTGVTTSSNANCSNSNTGAISLNVTGGTPAYTYGWSHGATTQNATGLLPGVYSVLITDANGCSNMYIDTVGAVSPSYSVAFTANPQAGTAPFTPAFANSTPNAANYNFTWYFGDGTSVVNNNPTVFHTYQFNGLYDVTLVATSIATGCSDTLTKPGFIYATGGAGCTHTVAITPSSTQNACQGDTVLLSCNTDPSFTYQWNVNSIAISGATSPTLAVTQSGYYGVTVVQNNCPVTSVAVQVNVTTNPPAPNISSSGSMVACIGGSVTLTATNIPGVTYLWSTGSTSQSVVVTSAGAYAVTVTNTAGCSATATDSVSSGVNSWSICMVTVDSTSTKNQIVWTKPVSAAIDSFKVYREVASSYKHVGSVPYNSLSTFTDNTTGVNPKITAYKYKITVVDTCGDESPLSAFHRTIHLAISPATPCGFNLSWNDYIGLPVTQYRIMRDSAGTGWAALDSVSFGTTAWTDISCYPSQDTIAYRLEIDHPGGCVISAKDPQPMANLNLSKSNIQKNFQTATSVDPTVTLPNIAILPNPSSGMFTIKSDVSITSIEVMNLLGEVLFSSQLTSTKADIDLTGRPEGIYLLRVNSHKGAVVNKIVISK